MNEVYALIGPLKLPKYRLQQPSKSLKTRLKI